MIQLFTYLLEASVIILILSLLYRVFFRKLTFYKINRVLLLLTIVAGLAIPLININISSSESPALKNLVLPEVYAGEPVSFDESSQTEVANPLPYNEISTDQLVKAKAINQGSQFDWILLFAIIYFAGVTVVFTRLCISLYKFSRIKNSSEYCGNANHYIIQGGGSSFSFFNWVFIDSETISSDQYQVVLKHERLHSSLLHSLDVLLFEIGKAILWFNPVIYLLAKESRLINEFYTDQLVVGDEGLEVYSNTLINYQQNNLERQSALLVANSFALLSLKPRVMQLVKKPSDNRSKLSYLAVLPILSLFFVAFSCNLTEEPDFNQNIKSVKAYFFDEYGDQEKRNGELILEVNLNPDGNFANEEGFTRRHYNPLKSNLKFIQWGKEVEILQFGNEWPKVRSEAIERTVVAHEEWYNRDNLVVTKYAATVDSFYTKALTIRETDADGYGIIKVKSIDESGKAWSTSLIDNGERYEFDEMGKITELITRYFDDEEYLDNKINNNETGSMFSISYLKEKKYEFTYDGNSNLISSSLNGELKKSFEYDKENRLSDINVYKNDQLVSTYQLSYNAENQIAKVKAYNGMKEIEFTTQYEYQYY